MPTPRLAYLFKKYFDKTATPEEITEFMALADSEEHAAEVQALMEQTWTGFDQPTPFFSEKESQTMLQSVLAADSGVSGAFAASVSPESISVSSVSTMGADAPVPVRRMNWIRVAASLLAIALTGGIGWWYYQHKPTPAQNIAQTTPVKKPVTDIQPGGNKARLILDDGSSIVLDSARTGVLTVQGNTQVEQTAAGRLAYNTGQKSNPSAQPAVPNPAPGETAAVLFNTIQTPTGGQYQVSLPDGSKVWLNASSSLRFPTAFKGKDRTVELTGEAYFEIEPHKEQPFHVKVNDMTVDVLGTHFNVMAYGDEGSINTSLLEGAVRIEKGGQARTLKPGQQVLLSRETGALTVEEADTEQVVAWKNGLFQFEGATLGTIMRQVQRWYDVDVRYEGTVSRHFSGLISRSATLKEVLHMLDLAGKARFSLEGTTVVIKP